MHSVASNHGSSRCSNACNGGIATVGHCRSTKTSLIGAARSCLSTSNLPLTFAAVERHLAAAEVLECSAFYLSSTASSSEEFVFPFQCTFSKCSSIYLERFSQASKMFGGVTALSLQLLNYRLFSTSSCVVYLTIKLVSSGINFFLGGRRKMKRSKVQVLEHDDRLSLKLTLVMEMKGEAL